jgi:hypothetical protein
MPSERPFVRLAEHSDVMPTLDLGSTFPFCDVASRVCVDLCFFAAVFAKTTACRGSARLRST